MTHSTRRPRRAATRVTVLTAAVLGLASPLVALAASRGPGSTTAPSFTRDVAPVIQQKCAGCHRTGGVAPFALDTARAISSRAPLIAAAVEARLMPPWPPGAKSPAFVGESHRTLTARERMTILSWVDAGARVDGPARAPLPKAPVDVRDGERVLELAMPAVYRPRARDGTTDDYRCFVLDPKLTRDVSVTSARIVPGASRIVHHVILFRIPRSQVAEARRLDAGTAGPGWTCFGGTGLSLAAGVTQNPLEDANWIGAWAPGGTSGRLPDGTGVPLPAGNGIVMQVHYNLLNGASPDRSHALLTLAPASARLTPVHTVLLPAPVELACAQQEHGPLCDRGRALGELARKYGSTAAFVPTGLLLLCGRSTADVASSEVSRCDRRIDAPTTILGAAGHMHLLGSSIRLELDPGTPRAKVLLDIPRWDFHWQSMYLLQRPVRARPGDVVRVSCRYDVSRRHHGTHGIPPTPRYVLWGEGTTDEMCLGLLQVTRG
jgi:hypothetical protein